MTSRRSNRRLGFGSEEHELVRATRARPRGGGRLPGAALAPLAEFRLEPVEENTATRVPERARVGTDGPRFREMRASLGPPTDRSLHMTVQVTEERTVTQPRATQRGFQDDKGFKNTFLQTSPRCTALAAAPVTLVWDIRIR